MRDMRCCVVFANCARVRYKRVLCANCRGVGCECVSAWRVRIGGVHVPEVDAEQIAKV